MESLHGFALPWLFAQYVVVVINQSTSWNVLQTAKSYVLGLGT